MKEWNEVEAFKDWWIAAGCPIRPPFEYPIHITDMAYALTVYRKGQYQVELYIVKPNTETTKHSHPNIDSISMYLTGNMTFAKENEEYIDLSKLQKEGANGTHVLLGSIAETNNGKVHSLKVGPEGGAFLIFEFWKDRDPVSVTVHWEGDLVGEQHAQTIKDREYVVNS